MGKKRDIEIQQIINSSLDLSYNWFHVNMDGKVYGIGPKSTPTYDEYSWAVTATNAFSEYLGNVEAFKSEGWKHHLYNSKGVKVFNKDNFNALTPNVSLHYLNLDADNL